MAVPMNREATTPPSAAGSGVCHSERSRAVEKPEPQPIVLAREELPTDKALAITHAALERLMGLWLPRLLLH